MAVSLTKPVQEENEDFLKEESLKGNNVGYHTPAS